MAAPAQETERPRPKPRSGGTRQPVTMKVETPRDRPPEPPDEPGDGGDRPWWSRFWLPITIVAAILLPAVTLWSVGSFSPTLDPPKPLGDELPGTVDIVIHWVIEGVVVVVAGYGLKRGWGILPLVTLGGFGWAWFSNMVRRPDVAVDLLWPSTLFVFVGFVAAIIGQFVYNKLNP